MDDDTSKDRLDELAADYLSRRRRGETPELSEYTQMYPALAEDIRDLFPTISALEELKSRQRPAPSGDIQATGGRLTHLDEFEVIAEIGRGGMGVVYEAVQPSLDRRVALKVLLAPSLSSAHALARFEREARIAARLQHPAIVPIYRFGEAEGYHYIAMQRIQGVGWDQLVERLAAANAGDPVSVPEAAVDEGRVLRHLAQTLFDASQGAAREDAVDRQGPWVLPLAGKAFRFGPKFFAEVGAMAQTAAEALQYAHDQKVWHRDIKPSNLIMDKEGRVWITDFGLAKIQGGGDSLTATGSLLGTLRFMAPENFEGRHDARSDIYSLGLTLYELAALQPAFQGNNQSELIRRILNEPPPPPERLNPFVPPPLSAIIARATAKNPAARYPSAAAMAKDLQRFLDKQPVLAASGSSLPSPAPESQRPRRRRLLALAAAIAILAGAAMYLSTAEAPSTQPAPSVTRSPVPPAVEMEARPAPRTAVEMPAAAGTPTAPGDATASGSPEVGAISPPPDVSIFNAPPPASTTQPESPDAASTVVRHPPLRQLPPGSGRFSQPPPYPGRLPGNGGRLPPPRP